MGTESFWNELQSQCERLEPGAALVTPVSERQFSVDSIEPDRIVITFDDSGERRPLWCEQFEVFLERLSDGAIPVDDLPPGVEPYASLLTLTAEHTVADGAIASDPDATAGGESPFLVSAAEARTPPERVRDDALLLADHLERLGAAPEALDTESLADRYVLLSDVQRGADRLRREVRGPLLERLGPDQQLHGHFGTVRRTTRERRRTRDEEAVFDALDERGIPREWVLGVDREKLDVMLAVTDLEADEVYDVDEQVYAQKTKTDESEKYSRLEGVANRLAELEGEEGEELRDELAEIEDRLEEALSAG
jgi:hypothetical protein